MRALRRGGGRGGESRPLKRRMTMKLWMSALMRVAHSELEQLHQEEFFEYGKMLEWKILMSQKFERMNKWNHLYYLGPRATYGEHAIINDRKYEKVW